MFKKRAIPALKKHKFKQKIVSGLHSPGSGVGEAVGALPAHILDRKARRRYSPDNETSAAFEGTTGIAYDGRAPHVLQDADTRPGIRRETPSKLSVARPIRIPVRYAGEGSPQERTELWYRFFFSFATTVRPLSPSTASGGVVLSKAGSCTSAVWDEVPAR